MAILRPGVPTAMFGRLDAQFKLRGRIALTPVADAIVRQAKINSGFAQHPYGTKSPAIPGTGPAMISRTLNRAIDRSEVTREPFGYLCQIGVAVNRFPATYRSKKAADQYGYVLEVTGIRNGSKYPFLYPAARFGFDHVAPIIYREKYGSGWARLI